MLPGHPHEENNGAKQKYHEALQHVILAICCVFAAWVAKGFLLKFTQKAFWQESRETFDNGIVEEYYTRNLEYWRNY